MDINLQAAKLREIEVGESSKLVRTSDTTLYKYFARLAVCLGLSPWCRDWKADFNSSLNWRVWLANVHGIWWNGETYLLSPQVCRFLLENRNSIQEWASTDVGLDEEQRRGLPPEVGGIENPTMREYGRRHLAAAPSAATSGSCQAAGYLRETAEFNRTKGPHLGKAGCSIFVIIFQVTRYYGCGL